MVQIDIASLVESGMEHRAIDAPPSDEQQQAFDKIVRWLNVRDRSQKEVRDRLLKNDCSPDVADDAIRRAVRCGLLDDLRFADVLIRTRLTQGKGRKGIEHELAELNICVGDVPDWPERYFPEGGPTEFDRAMALLERKPTRSKNPRAAAYRKLYVNGYSSSVAESASRAFVAQRFDF
ncbi:regulatory protein RecX [Slackia heliotrinireducens]|jgi:regulatory protein|uniref:regulatory protein RecX n=1 Tax=Slackia heliotrinireducens TaxID=84110 RepID=UPI0033146C88